jgi:hypothetical protein
MTITATMLPTTETSRYFVVVNPTPYDGLVANAVPKVTTVVPMTFISAMHATRAMFPAAVAERHDDGRRRHLAVLGLLLERRGLVDRRRMM